MNRYALIAITLLVLLANSVADAQWRSKTHDVYNALTGVEVEIDGNLGADEWDGVFETVTGTNGEIFCGVEYEGKAFAEHDGGKWDGPEDHQTCFAIVWDSEALYIALRVTDDEHEHADGRAWNGDGAQLAFEPTGDRDAGLELFLYNAGLDDNAENILLGNEATHGSPGLVAGEHVAIVRNEDKKETYYEFKVTAEELQVRGDKFSEDYELGLGICVNDGDKAEGQGGQKGWSGWYPNSIVHGKDSDNTGLVVLTNETLAVEATNKLATTWGKLKSVP